MIKPSEKGLSTSGLFRRKRRETSEPGFPEIKGQHYIRTIAQICEKLGANWYLEIGSRTGDSLAAIPCNFVAIDPEFMLGNPVFQAARQMHFFQMTSDDFFADGFLARNGIRPDVAFVDGMHHFEFALRDFMNCEAAMSTNGAIILHDVCPTTHAMATRDFSQLEQKLPWTGDVWKVVAALREFRPDLDVSVLNTHKTGIAVIRGLDPSNRVIQNNYDAIVAKFLPLQLREYGVSTYYEQIGLVDAATYVDNLLG